MVTMKEAGPGYPIQKTEVPGEEQNSFIGFIGKNQEIFDRHSFLTYELRDEEAGWRNSPTVDSLVNMGFAVMRIVYPQINMFKGGRLRQTERLVRGNIERIIFSNTHEKRAFADGILPQTLSSLHRISPQTQTQLEAIAVANEDFRTTYNEAVSPLVLGIRESKAELMGKFEEFLLSDSQNIFAFADFLSDKKNNGAKIEAIRPFLSSLVESEQMLAREKKEGILRSVGKKWTGELKEKPDSVAIDEFVELINSKSPNIHEWLEFAAQGIDTASFLKSRADVSSWPKELRESLFTLVSSRYNIACSSVERELEGFRRRPNSRSKLPTIDFEQQSEKRSRGPVADTEEQDNEEVSSEASGEQKYPIGTLTREIDSSSEVRALTSEGLSHYLQKEADSLDSADPRMVADLKVIFSSLQNDPYGLGTKKFPVHTVGVKNRRIPLRSLNPGRRIGLPLEHPQAQRLRIVYVIDRLGGVSRIGIEGVYKHEDYEKKFA